MSSCTDHCRSATAPQGYTLPAFSWFIDQTIGGAVATATHGSSLRHGSLSNQASFQHSPLCITLSALCSNAGSSLRNTTCSMRLHHGVCLLTTQHSFQALSHTCLSALQWSSVFQVLCGPTGDVYTSCPGERHSCQLLTSKQQALVEGNAGLPSAHATCLQLPKTSTCMSTCQCCSL